MNLRLAAVFVLSLLVLTATAAAGTWFWSIPKVLRLIDDTRVHVGSKTVRIHRETTLCAGSGASIRRDGVKRWRRFVCTFTTFTKRGLDRDLDFRVLVTGRRRFRLVDAHWVQAPR
jgi:hypothetical protein